MMIIYEMGRSIIAEFFRCKHQEVKLGGDPCGMFVRAVISRAKALFRKLCGSMKGGIIFVILHSYFSLICSWSRNFCQIDNDSQI